MNVQMTLEESDVDICEFDDTVDQVTGVRNSVEMIPRNPNLRMREPSSWISEAARQFQAIEQLRHGWDSQGADPPDRETVWSGASLLRVLATADAYLTKPHIHPTRAGGVQFHWESGSRYFEIEILDPHSAQFYYVDKNTNDETEGNLRVGGSVARVLRLVRRINQRP